MTRLNDRGFTLIEMLVVLSIFALIAAAATSLLSTSLVSYAQGNARYGLYREGLMIMERLTSQVRRSTFLLIPNAHTTDRDILAVSGSVNEDNDYYFDDPLFPRIDEDLKKDMTDDDEAGIAGIDDDGDGQIDEGDKDDDDEDGLIDEDPLDGIDNDGDGNVDEDTGDDSNISGMDDDGDGTIDEGDSKDDDEDGTINEDPVTVTVYSYDGAATTLRESTPYNAQTAILSTRVSAFQTTWETPNRLLITLTLTSADGESVTFSEYVHVVNTYQRFGKRVK